MLLLVELQLVIVKLHFRCFRLSDWYRIQNIPEGAELSMPIRAAGASRWKAFNYGQASAIVEPIFATIGAALILVITPILPYALALQLAL